MGLLNKKRGATTSTASKLWHIDHISGNKYVLMLLDQPPVQDNNYKTAVLALENLLQRNGINSYVITSSLSFVPTEKDLKKGKTEFYCKNRNDWKMKIVDENREKGIECECCIPFGPSLYQVTKSTDVLVEDIYFPLLGNYIYMGHGFVGDYDMFFFPVHSFKEIFFPGGDVIDVGSSHYKPASNGPAATKVDLTTWKYNFLAKQVKNIATHNYKLPDDMRDYTITVAQSQEEADYILKSHFNEEYCSFDLETSGFDQWNDRIKCITLCFNSVDGYYIDWKFVNKKLLSDMMKSCKHRLGVNAKFDIKFLWVNGVDEDVDVTDDVMLMSHALCSARKKGLKSMAFYYTPFGGYDDDLDVYKNVTGCKDYSKIPEPILSKYATLDAIVALRCYHALYKDLHDFDKAYPNEKNVPGQNLEDNPWCAWNFYERIMMGIYDRICKIEYRGVYLNEEVLEKHKDILRGIIEENKKKLGEILEVDAETFKWGSQKELGKLLEEKGWPCAGRAKDGGYLTNEEAFMLWDKMKVTGSHELKELRQATAYLNSYLGAEEFKVNVKTGEVLEEDSGWSKFIVRHEDDTIRIHSNFIICGTETYRFISTAPNMQNLPTHSKMAPLVKMCIGVPPSDEYEITGESGTTYHLFSSDKIKVVSGDGYKYIYPELLTENDTICEADDGNPVVMKWQGFSELNGF